MSNAAEPVRIGADAKPLGEAASNSRAALQSWNGPAIAGEIHSKSLGNAYRQWLFHRGNRQPRLRDMFVKASNTSDDMLLNLKVGDDYVVVAQSQSYIRNVGRDMRGALTSEMKFATANSLRELSDECLDKRRPIYARYISSLSEQNVYWETLLLPLSVDERSPPVFVLNYLAMLNEKVDVLQVLYDRSPVAIVAAVPIMDGQNKTNDARILTMNAKARQILKQNGSAPLHSIGEMIQLLHGELHWSGVSTKVEGPFTCVTYRDPAGAEFNMTIELINQFILVSIAERGHIEPTSAGRLARLLGLG